MQTILGAGGDVANLLAKELKQYTQQVRLVSRNPKQVNGDDELMALDLSKKENVLKAIEGSEVVYLVISSIKPFHLPQPVVLKK